MTLLERVAREGLHPQFGDSASLHEACEALVAWVAAGEGRDPIDQLAKLVRALVRGGWCLQDSWSAVIRAYARAVYRIAPALLGDVIGPTTTKAIEAAQEQLNAKVVAW